MRLDQLAEELGDQIVIEWKSYLLRPEPKTSDRESFIEYTKSWLRPAETEPQTSFTVWSSDADQPASSMPAQVAAKAVESLFPDKIGDFHRSLLSAYFTDNRNIGDDEVILDIAEETGIDRKQLMHGAAEHSHEFTERVIAEHNSAMNMGISGVPTVVFEGSFGVPGAQPVETYRRLAERIVEKKSQLASVHDESE